MQIKDQMKKSVGKFAKGKYKKVEQAIGLSLRNLFEQLAWRISPAAMLYGCQHCFVAVFIYLNTNYLHKVRAPFWKHVLYASG